MEDKEYIDNKASKKLYELLKPYFDSGFPSGELLESVEFHIIRSHSEDAGFFVSVDDLRLNDFRWDQYYDDSDDFAAEIGNLIENYNTLATREIVNHLESARKLVLKIREEDKVIKFIDEITEVIDSKGFEVCKNLLSKTEWKYFFKYCEWLSITVYRDGKVVREDSDGEAV